MLSWLVSPPPILSLLGILFLLVSGCASFRLDRPAETHIVQVFAAASLAEAFQEAGDKFSEDNPGIEVVFNFAGSQSLAQQISHGAPADVFASADEAQMQIAVESGRIDAGDVIPFAANQLVVAFPIENPGQVIALDDLAVPGLVIVMAAREVPAGRYSMDFLQKASQARFGSDYQSRVLSNVVSFEENVRSVLSKIALGEADAGLVYQSDVRGDQAEKIGVLVIPTALNVAAVYPLARLNDSPNPVESEAFIDFILSPPGQEILARYGFGSSYRGDG